jgi:hypothetical protein
MKFARRRSVRSIRQLLFAPSPRCTNGRFSRSSLLGPTPERTGLTHGFFCMTAAIRYARYRHGGGRVRNQSHLIVWLSGRIYAVANHNETRRNGVTVRGRICKPRWRHAELAQ